MFGFCLLFLILCTLQNSAQQTQKNVIIILADDGGIDLKIYGNPDIDSPNIDALGNKGMVFTAAYTSVSSCSPSRAALLTGLPSHQNGMYGLQHTIHHYKSFHSNNPNLPHGTVLSITNILQSNGYFTAIIGKYNLAPTQVYSFNYSKTEYDGYDIKQIGRNITFMNELLTDFFDNILPSNTPFFLFLSFHDPHRCSIQHLSYGSFTNYWGNVNYNNSQFGIIPDWKPKYYDPELLQYVPYYIPTTKAAIQDWSNYYTTYNRVDQGVGLFVAQFEQRGYMNESIIIFTSDNGNDFPNGRTNLYENGMIEPFIITIPQTIKQTKAVFTDQLASLLDVVPTILDFVGIEYPNYNLEEQVVTLSGISLIPLIESGGTLNLNRTAVFGSQNLHEVTMYYPMRVIRDKRYRLINNLMYRSPFHIDENFYYSLTWQDILNNTYNNQSTLWFKNTTMYYFRNEWELYDLDNDPKEINNLYGLKQYDNIFENLSKQLMEWRNKTNDPWICDQREFVCWQPYQWDTLPPHV